MGLVDGVQFQEPKDAALLPLSVTALSPGVHCLHNWFTDWGPASWRILAHNYKYSRDYNALAAKRWPSSGYVPPILPTQYTQKWAEGRIDEALSKIAKGLVIAAFPCFAPYNKNASLLMQKGFKLLGGVCYPNANYPISSYSNIGKGNIYSPDGYGHWIHIWAKDLGGLTTCGEATYGLLPPDQRPVGWQRPDHTGFPNCCGLRMRFTASDLKADAFNPQSNPNRYLAICQITADQKFPKGWKRFALYRDFKWGVNFGVEAVKGVQKCPHEFDLKKIEAWELAQPLPKFDPIKI